MKQEDEKDNGKGIAMEEKWIGMMKKEENTNWRTG